MKLRLRCNLLFEPRDLWCGIYWTADRAVLTDTNALEPCLQVYVCLVPMLPLRFTIWREERA